jgi:deoxycitidine kinase/deoxyguanosine kinase
MNSLNNQSIMQTKVQLLSIEGNIGSGKSTLLANLERHYKNTDNDSIIFLKEPVDEWATIRDENGITMLEKFYENQNKYSFAFQMMAYISRLSAIKSAIVEKKRCEEIDRQQINKKIIIITERSLFTDKMVFAQMLYDSGSMEHIQHQIYLKWFDSFADEYPVSKVVYVKTSPSVCYDRISKRSRAGENQIPLEYLDQCDLYHEKMLSDPSFTKNQLILDGNIDIYENKIELNEWIQKIDEFIHLNI